MELTALISMAFASIYATKLHNKSSMTDLRVDIMIIIQTTFCGVFN